jgi:hypothetical protein
MNGPRVALLAAFTLCLSSSVFAQVANDQFSRASGVAQLDANTYQIIAEVWDSPNRSRGVISKLHFDLPPGVTVTQFEGTVASQTFCGGTQVLFVLNVDGQRYAPVIHKFMARGSNTTFVHYTIPINTRSGKASVEIGATGTCPVNEEIQGLLRIEP